jgi:hypothetical protein
LTTVERTAYPRFDKNINSKSIIKFYTPNHEELELAHRIAKGQVQILNFIVMLKSFQRLGYFPKADDVPVEIVKYISSRLKIPSDIEFALPERTRYRYKISIRE